MEPDLMNKFGKLSFKTQVKAFYTAYSKAGFPFLLFSGDILRFAPLTILFHSVLFYNSIQPTSR